jgi:hypothetical protein
MKMDKEIVFPSSRHGHSQCLFIAQVMWWKKHKKFRKILVQDLIVQLHEANITVSGVSQGRQTSSGAQLSRLEVKHLQHGHPKGHKDVMCVR